MRPHRLVAQPLRVALPSDWVSSRSCRFVKSALEGSEHRLYGYRRLPVGARYLFVVDRDGAGNGVTAQNYHAFCKASAVAAHRHFFWLKERLFSGSANAENPLMQLRARLFGKCAGARYGTACQRWARLASMATSRGDRRRLRHGHGNRFGRPRQVRIPVLAPAAII